MPEQNDHDILIELKTSMAIMLQQQYEFFKRYEERHTALVGRVTVLEQQDSRDSEKFRSIMDQIQRSLNNSNKIDALTSDVHNLGENFRELKAKSNLWDIANAIGVAVAGVIGWNR